MIFSAVRSISVKIFGSVIVTSVNRFSAVINSSKRQPHISRITNPIWAPEFCQTVYWKSSYGIMSMWQHRVKCLNKLLMPRRKTWNQYEISNYHLKVLTWIRLMKHLIIHVIFVTQGNVQMSTYSTKTLFTT